jgi:chromosome segregation ATPase
MAQGNGQEDNLSRLDRIEAEHAEFRAEHKMLLRSQVLLQGSLETLKGSVEELKGSVEEMKVRFDEIGDKLNGLIGVVEHDHREFHQRLKRLEEKQ